MEEIYHRLKRHFNLTDNHLSIIKLLRQEKLDAKKIAQKTHIPVGRIYDHLNYLLQNRLIERTNKRPFSYFIHNINEQIIGFMKHNIDTMQGVQNKIIEKMQTPGIECVELIENSKKFTETHLSMISESKKISYISIHQSVPYVLYPLNLDKFLTLRKEVAKSRPTITYFSEHLALLIQKTYRQAACNGVNINVIFEREAFNYFVQVIKEKLGSSYFAYWKKTVLDQFNTYNLKAFVIDEYTPMQMDVNEKKVSISLRHLGVTSGIIIESKEITKFYNAIFEQNMNRSENVVPIIEQLSF